MSHVPVSTPTSHTALLSPSARSRTSSQTASPLLNASPRRISLQQLPGISPVVASDNIAPASPSLAALKAHHTAASSSSSSSSSASAASPASTTTLPTVRDMQLALFSHRICTLHGDLVHAARAAVGGGLVTVHPNGQVTVAPPTTRSRQNSAAAAAAAAAVASPLSPTASSHSPSTQSPHHHTSATTTAVTSTEATATAVSTSSLPSTPSSHPPSNPSTPTSSHLSSVNFGMTIEQVGARDTLLSQCLRNLLTYLPSINPPPMPTTTQPPITESMSQLQLTEEVKQAEEVPKMEVYVGLSFGTNIIGPKSVQFEEKILISLPFDPNNIPETHPVTVATNPHLPVFISIHLLVDIIDIDCKQITFVVESDNKDKEHPVQLSKATTKWAKQLTESIYQALYKVDLTKPKALATPNTQPVA